MKSHTKVVITLAALGILGCSLITDFDEDLINGIDAVPVDEIYSLKDNIGESVTALLNKDRTAQIFLDLDQALPVPTVEDQETIQSLFTSETITLEVQNTDTLTTVNILDGTMVDNVPVSSGQYTITIDESRLTVTITFFNEIAGKSLYLNKNYQALIEVKQNEQKLKVEAFVVPVVTAVSK